LRRALATGDGMQFNYRKEPDHTKPKKDWIKRPKLQVKLFNGSLSTDLICLVDSGADDCMFHSSIGDVLGIDLKSGSLKRFGGIAEGVVVDCYLHPIELQIYGFSERISVVAAFSDQVGAGGLLGQSGFFENYKVDFEGYRGKMEITSKPIY
jgi:hypothetical protein